jgi:hypothetical protein
MSTFAAILKDDWSDVDVSTSDEIFYTFLPLPVFIIFNSSEESSL